MRDTEPATRRRNGSVAVADWAGSGALQSGQRSTTSAERGGSAARPVHGVQSTAAARLATRPNHSTRRSSPHSDSCVLMPRFLVNAVLQTTSCCRLTGCAWPRVCIRSADRRAPEQSAGAVHTHAGGAVRLGNRATQSNSAKQIAASLASLTCCCLLCDVRLALSRLPTLRSWRRTCPLRTTIRSPSTVSAQCEMRGGGARAPARARQGRAEQAAREDESDSVHSRAVRLSLLLLLLGCHAI